MTTARTLIFQLSGYLPFNCKDAWLMHDLGVFVKSNLPIVPETIEDENESDFVWLFHIQPPYFSCIFRNHLVLWLGLCHPIYTRHILQPFANIMVCGDFNADTTRRLRHSLPLMLQVFFVKSLLLYGTTPHPDCRFPYSHS